ncbi:hypothetical protein SAMN06269117_12521 [Balnearium lithotrophicum]|uniref:RelE toxin of RelE / RelB toxin-antitoxin system n=1 Tax=Balnearium lithotrophicum TaxID=223788 RepID=A0A521DVF9_9BACT|nr:hypothetical protein SAMN06269117_12521 [Balnearium lithotrophicum]
MESVALAELLVKNPESLKLQVLLHKEDDFALYKSRLKGCSGRGKSGGLRLIWGVYDQALIFVRLYSKSEFSNIPVHELLDNLLNCLEEENQDE